MQWTMERIEQIPEIYRDFMLVLKAIPDSKNAALQITGLPLSKIFNALHMRWDYDPEQIRALADRLAAAHLVEVDHLGFVRPTAGGEQLIGVLAHAEEEPVTVPDFPSF